MTIQIENNSNTHLIVVSDTLDVNCIYTLLVYKNKVISNRYPLNIFCRDTTYTILSFNNIMLEGNYTYEILSVNNFNIEDKSVVASGYLNVVADKSKNENLLTESEIKNQIF